MYNLMGIIKNETTPRLARIGVGAFFPTSAADNTRIDIMQGMEHRKTISAKYHACSLLFLSLAMLFLMLCCTGCFGPKTGSISANNVFDEMLACDVVEFTEASDGIYEGEWRKLDDGFELKSEEEGVPVMYSFGRDFDDDETPYKLTFSKSVYAPVSDSGVLVVTKREVYSGKTGALREEDTTYQRSDPRDRVDLADPTRTEYPYVRLSAEEAQAELESTGEAELVGRLLGSPSEYFVDLYFGCMDSSFSTGNLGTFEDQRKQASQ